MKGYKKKNKGGSTDSIEALNRRFGSSFAQARTMHKAKCADCGQECEVPFMPKEGRPIYCRMCYPKHKPQR